MRHHRTRRHRPASGLLPRSFVRALAGLFALVAVVAILPGCGATVTAVTVLLADSGGGGGGASDNQPTTIVITSIERTRDDAGETVTKVSFVAIDPESDPAAIEAFYRIPGTDFTRATLVGGTAGPDGTFETAEEGKAHFVIWDQGLDLGPLPVRDVEFKLGDETSEPFTAGNALPDVVAIQGPAAGQVVGLSEPGGDGRVAVSFVVADPDDAAVEVAFAFQPDGASRPAVPLTIVALDGATAAFTGTVPAVAASPSGTPHTVLWDAVGDLGLADARGMIVATPRDSFGESPARASGTFLLNENEEPGVLAIETPALDPATGRVTIRYRLRDPDPGDDTAFVRPLFRVLRPGAPALGPFAATPAAGAPGHEGAGPLSASAAGEFHAFVWESAADLPRVPPLAPALGAQETVVFVLEPADAALPDPRLGVGLEASSAPFAVDNTKAPRAVLEPGFVESPAGVTETATAPPDRLFGDVKVSFRLEDDDVPAPATLTAELELSVDGGASFRPMRIAAVNGQARVPPLVGVVPDLARGVRHTVVWPSRADGVGVPPDASVRIRVTAVDSKRGLPAVSPDLGFDNGAITLASAPFGTTFGDRVPIELAVAKENAASVVDVRVLYRVGGGPFRPATEAHPAAGVSAVLDVASGVRTFVWSSFFDLALAPATAVSPLVQPGVTLRLVAANRRTGETTDPAANEIAIQVANDGIATVLGGPDAPGGVPAGPASLSDTTGGVVLGEPHGLAVLASGDLLIADTANGLIRYVNRGATPVTFAGVTVAPGRIATVAGGGRSGLGDGGAALAAELNFPEDVALDLPGGGDPGRFYVADTRNGRVREVDLATLRISTVGGSDDPASASAIVMPSALAVRRASGVLRVYAVERSANGRVLEIDPALGTVTVVAGGGATPDFTSLTTAAADAGFANAGGLAFDDAARLLVAEADLAPGGAGGRIKRIDLGARTVTRVAGRGDGSPGAPVLEGTALDVELAELGHLSLGGDGLFYVPTADARVYALNLRATTRTAYGVTVAGSEARIVAGSGTEGAGAEGLHGDGGPALLASLSVNRAAVRGPAAELFVAATRQGRIRRVLAAATAAAATVETAVGRYGPRPVPDGRPGPETPLLGPVGLDVAPFDGLADEASLLVTDPGRGADVVHALGLADGVARLVPGVVAAVGTIPASDPGWPGRPRGLRFDPTAPLVYTTHPAGPAPASAAPDRIIRWDRGFVDPVRVAGGGSDATPDDTTLARDAVLVDVRYLAIDPTRGELYFSETGRNRVWRLEPSGLLEKIAGDDGGAAGATLGPDGNTTRLDGPRGLAFDAAGDLHVCDAGNHRVLRLDLGGAGGRQNPAVSLAAGGNGQGFAGDGGPATAARLDTPSDVAIGLDGSIYVADSGNHRIRRFTLGGGIATVAGSALTGLAGDGGPPARAALLRPEALAVDPAGHIYILDAGNGRVRRFGVGGP